ncbi:cell wall-binding repeat-containing protein [Georgenia sp. SYP-B2076]|uniref:cell wall-binding repeat-containing protein n=1 Tax=Georgenia sp. SYP-B2076 TaxID=2495881 RepID=UPI0013DFC700|nr:cell wall-binding repeat-containing protein [Georgenia sp. SYP-B2076]
MRKTPLAVLGAVAVVVALATGAGAGTTSTRLAGHDRYGTAVAISRYAYEPRYTGEPVTVTVTSGADFVDARAAGTAASHFGGPLVLVPTDGTLPATVAAELKRLHPAMVVIAGGALTVSGRIESQLKHFGWGTVYRPAGQDRYQTAAYLAGLAGGLNTTVFIATGEATPDALGGTAAAGRLGGSLLLTGRDIVPDATARALARNRPAKVVVLGGETSVSPAVFEQIKRLTPSASVERWAGGDRYETAAVISKRTYPRGAGTVYLASGSSYADAYAGAPAAAANGAPLLLTTPNCVPASTAAEITRLGARTVVVLGGLQVVSAEAANLAGC